MVTEIISSSNSEAFIRQTVNLFILDFPSIFFNFAWKYIPFENA